MRNQIIYTGASLEDLLESKDFISLAKTINDQEWNLFIADASSSEKKKLVQARNIINMMGSPASEHSLSKNQKEQLWNEIVSKSEELQTKSPKIIDLRDIWKVAAVILIILSAGSVALWQNLKGKDNFAFTDSLINEEKPLLVLSEGKKIEINSSKAELEVIENKNAIRINRDSVVESTTQSLAKGETPKMNKIIVPFGTKTSLKLSDGTRVWLNAGSQLAFPTKFANNSRTVYLRGEGYFEVSKNKKKPFFVETPNVQVHVLGTHFNVSAYADDKETETVLLEGSVAIKSKNGFFNKEMIMNPGQKATYKESKNKISIKDAENLHRYISWREGWYEFSNEHLSIVFTKLERYYNIDFRYDKYLIKNSLPISGKLDINNSIEAVMDVLSKVAKIDYSISGNQITVASHP
jgi:ferric-dicitrate binding protein FerR (iron transport regulator)